MADEVVILKWTFSPPDYFEETFVIERDSYTMTIDKGTAKARIDPAVYDGNRDMRNAVHNKLNDCFLGVQLLTHKPYKLSNASMFRRYSDGREVETVFPGPAVVTISMTQPDVVVRDKDGRILEDSRQDRIEHEKKLARLVAKHRPKDEVVASLIASHDRAVNDPDDELVHLYEVKEALTEAFCGEGKAQKALGISKTKWGSLGRLANVPHFRQGRHRGKNAGELRGATREELKEAREISRKMIEAYFDHLEFHATKQSRNS